MSIQVPPFWHIGPPDMKLGGSGVALRLGAGAGFGDGAHETTQLCLQAIAATSPKHGAWQLLDFGSGSGILAIAAAKLRARVDAVEIDEAAIAHAHENARLNAVDQQILFQRSLDGLPGPYALIVANILRPVLLQAAPALAARLSPGKTLVLSGLVATDVPEIIARYSPLLAGRRPTIHQRGEWRAVVFWPES